MSDTITETSEAEYSEYDYTGQLDDIYYKLEQIEESTVLINENVQYLAYLPHIYEVTALILGSMIAITVYRLVTSFISRVFSDNTKI